MGNSNTPLTTDWNGIGTLVEGLPRATRRGFVQAAGLAGAIGAFSSGTAATDEESSGPAKSRRTYYTEERIENARANIEQHDWAASERDSVVEQADSYLDRYGLDGLWELITSPDIARAQHAEADRPGAWVPQGDEPWTCRIELDGEEWVLPTNDFEAYRQSGLDDRGFFDRDLADDDLLVNERYPDKDEDWGVDAGVGWVDEEGEIAQNPGGRIGGVVRWNTFYRWFEARRVIEACRDAYLYTGEQRYATAVGILLDRTADVYPEMDVAEDLPIDEVAGFEFQINDGGRGTGIVHGASVDPREIREFILAYDAIFPAIDDEELIEFLSEKADEYPGLDADQKSSADGIRAHFEDNVIREMLPAAKESRLTPTRGAPETLAVSGRVLDEPEEYTADAINFIFRDGEETWEPDGTPYGNWSTSGHALLSDLVEDRFDRDGFANEAAPNYNVIQQNRIRDVADYLDGYDGYTGADLYQHPQFQQAMHSHYPLVMLNRYMPNIGDRHGAGDPGLNLSQDTLQRGFEVYDEPILAQALYFRNGDSADGLRGDLFDEDPEGLDEAIEAVVDEHGTFDLGTTFHPGFGLAALRTGDEHQRACWVYYGRNDIDAGATSHAHLDTLNLGLMAYDLDLLPDLGYPEFTGVWPKRSNWTENTISHNTVLVDESPQDPSWVGSPLHQDSTGRIEFADVEADVYEAADEYRRTTAMVQADAETSYVVDFFHVDGGDDHHFSFHATDSAGVSTEGLELEAQEEGTYAGEDVPRLGHGEDHEYNEEVGNGFNYLFNVERDDSPSDSYSVDWDVRDYWDARNDNAEDVHVRLTMLTDCDEVALADGEPPQAHGNPETFKYLIAHRTGADLETTFASVIEPYEGERVVESIEEVSVEADDEDADLEAVSALKIELTTGRTDYVVCSYADDKIVVDETFEFEGFFGYYAEEDGEPEHAYVNDGTLLHPNQPGSPLIQEPRGTYLGTVKDFSEGMTHESEITVKLQGGHRDLVGDDVPFVYVDTDTDRNGVYPVADIESDAGNRVTIAIGDEIGGSRTLVRGFKNPEEFDDGDYVYNVETGADVTIPKAVSWADD